MDNNIDDNIREVIEVVINGRDKSYEDVDSLLSKFKYLIEYTLNNRDEREVDNYDIYSCIIISKALKILGFKADEKTGRDLWELVSEDSQAQWLIPPSTVDGVFINLTNVAQNMAKNQCNIDFI